MDVMTQVQQLQDQLNVKEQENQQLTAQLQHLRSWMSSLQQRAKANDPHALLVARELYVGGVPEGTTEVGHKVDAGLRSLHVAPESLSERAVKRPVPLIVNPGCFYNVDSTYQKPILRPALSVVVANQAT